MQVLLSWKQKYHKILNMKKKTVMPCNVNFTLRMLCLLMEK